MSPLLQLRQHHWLPESGFVCILPVSAWTTSVLRPKIIVAEMQLSIQIMKSNEQMHRNYATMRDKMTNQEKRSVYCMTVFQLQNDQCATWKSRRQNVGHGQVIGVCSGDSTSRWWALLPTRRVTLVAGKCFKAATKHS